MRDVNTTKASDHRKSDEQQPARREWVTPTFSAMELRSAEATFHDTGKDAGTSA